MFLFSTAAFPYRRRGLHPRGQGPEGSSRVPRLGDVASRGGRGRGRGQRGKGGARDGATHPTRTRGGRGVGAFNSLIAPMQSDPRGAIIERPAPVQRLTKQSTPRRADKESKCLRAPDRIADAAAVAAATALRRTDAAAGGTQPCCHMPEPCTRKHAADASSRMDYKEME